jgi:UDP-N-acetylglucosamine diphosphorylase/glucosamine-1-phosphate N-acetyltransferase
VNGCALLTKQIAARLHTDTRDCLYVSDRDVFAARISDEAEGRAFIDAASSGGLPEFMGRMDVVELPCVILKHPWDLVAHNTTMLMHDAAFYLESAGPNSGAYPAVYFLAPDNIFVGENVSLSPGVVLDAREGPIVIDDGAVVLPNAVILGPAYVGRNSKIKAGAKILEGSTIGPSCKIGGEVEDSIFHSFANKQHDGFVGHSYVASWTNLGADTNTSDLKNNYSEIRVTLEGKEFRTGRMLCGVIMAEHSKCGINTMFNTGTTVGVGCNLYGGDFPPKYIPSFSWGGSDGFVEHDFDRFLATAETVMARRGVRLVDAERALYRSVFETTEMQRTYKLNPMSH